MVWALISTGHSEHQLNMNVCTLRFDPDKWHKALNGPVYSANTGIRAESKSSLSLSEQQNSQCDVWFILLFWFHRCIITTQTDTLKRGPDSDQLYFSRHKLIKHAWISPDAVHRLRTLNLERSSWREKRWWQVSRDPDRFTPTPTEADSCETRTIPKHRISIHCCL